jgi:hypothetical protein
MAGRHRQGVDSTKPVGHGDAPRHPRPESSKNLRKRSDVPTFRQVTVFVESRQWHAGNPVARAFAVIMPFGESSFGVRHITPALLGGATEPAPSGLAPARSYELPHL